MARNSGDVCLSTFRSILSAMVENGHSPGNAVQFLYGLHDAGDGEAFDALTKMVKDQERAKSGWTAKAPGRKSSVDEHAVAVECLSKFVIGGSVMTPERLETITPESLKVALGKKVLDAIKAAKLAAKEAKDSEEIAKLAAQFARDEIAAMPSAKVA